MIIDNGNHLLLSGNHAALAYLAHDRRGRHAWSGRRTAEFPFVDLASGERWTLRINDGPSAVVDFRRAAGACRAPRASDYLALARLLWGTGERTIGEVVNCAGPLYDRLARPLLRRRAQHRAAGGQRRARRRDRARNAAARRRGLPAADCARRSRSRASSSRRLRYLASARRARCSSGTSCARSAFGDRASTALDFGERQVALGEGDAVVLAVPPWWPRRSSRASTRRTNSAPSSMRTSASSRRQGLPPIIGVVNATTEWLFAFPGRLSVTISAADRLLDIAARGARRDHLARGRRR